MKLVNLSTVVVRRVVTSILVAFIFAVALPQIAFAQVDPVIGTWKLNVAKSKFAPGPSLQSMTIRYEVAGQAIRNNFEGIDGEGKPVKGTFTIIADGKYYPVTGVPDFDSSAYKRVDAYTLENTRMKAGKVVQSGSRVMARDGRTLTFTARGVNAKGQQINDVVVYDKQ